MDTGVQRDPIDDLGRKVDTIDVNISYEIIKLFSEGLYQSPQKAVEELVSNGYDAGAKDVFVFLPQEAGQPRKKGNPTKDSLDFSEALWVIDDGDGMDSVGFHQLWKVASSSKASKEQSPNNLQRLPIGQFGIGKLAAYVLARRLTHVSKVDGNLLFTTMNFRRIRGRHQFANEEPLELELRQINVAEAQRLMSGLEVKNTRAWQMMFGPNEADSWTAAALTDFRELYEKLSSGRLAWVLRTGLPLETNFSIWIGGERLVSGKASMPKIKEFALGSQDDTAADKLNAVTRVENLGVAIPGISGKITGTAKIFERPLTTGKSEQYGRSHGFFVRVRGRVINLEDELFGLDVLNHSAWSRFSMEIHADGLREFLLSSREGVRDAEPVRSFRKYLHAVFNICRRDFNDWLDDVKVGVDIKSLMADSPSVFVMDPVVGGVASVLGAGREAFYVQCPQIEEGMDQEVWMEEFKKEAQKGPFREVRYVRSGELDRALRYHPESRTLEINEDHPFIEKLLATSRNEGKGPVTYFGSAEVFVDLMLLERGYSRAAVLDFMADRDKVLRLLGGDKPLTAKQVIRDLVASTQDSDALEKAIGNVFRVLGFEYQRRGGYKEGPDGVLIARLGRGGGQKLEDYKLVYDAKQTNQPAVPADKIDLASIEHFRQGEDADFAFFLAKEYAGEQDPDGKLNRKIRAFSQGAENASGAPVTALCVRHLVKIVQLHYQFGVTLTKLRDLFESASTVPEVDRWVQRLEKSLIGEEPQVPLRVLVCGLEAQKVDPKARPNIYSVRAENVELKGFSPEKLKGALEALAVIVGNRWVEIESTGDVMLHHTAEQILAVAEKNLHALAERGIDALDHPEVSV